MGVTRLVTPDDAPVLAEVLRVSRDFLAPWEPIRGGLATAAVRDMVRVAFDELRLHCVQAETLLHNVRSQRVLKRNGFRRIGMAPAYLKIAGRWQDHILYQVINDDA